MYSVSSLRRLSSHAFMTCLRLDPESNAPGPSGDDALVAMTTASRRFFTALPTMVSDFVPEYTFAVSMKLCPPSRYASIIAIDAFSSQPNCSLQKFIAPRHSGDTRSPDRPRFLKSVDAILQFLR